MDPGCRGERRAFGAAVASVFLVHAAIYLSQLEWNSLQIAGQALLVLGVLGFTLLLNALPYLMLLSKRDPRSLFSPVGLCLCTCVSVKVHMAFAAAGKDAAAFAWLIVPVLQILALGVLSLAWSPLRAIAGSRPFAR